MQLQESLRLYRLRCGLTQQEVMRRTQIDAAYLCRLERGKAKNPRLQILLALATEYGVSLDVLVGRVTEEVSHGTRTVCVDA